MFNRKYPGVWSCLCINILLCSHMYHTHIPALLSKNFLYYSHHDFLQRKSTQRDRQGKLNVIFSQYHLLDFQVDCSVLIVHDHSIL